MPARSDVALAGRDSWDAIVVGGGLIGMAIAFGLVRQGLATAVLDGADHDFRAATANFGLVWVQGKGVDNPAYVRWTRRSVRLWPALRDALEETTGIDVHLEQPGGFHYCLSEAELEQRERCLGLIRATAEGGDYPFEILDHAALARQVRGIGPQVAGASFCPEDGHVSPLLLGRALREAVCRLGGVLMPSEPMRTVAPAANGFELNTVRRRLRTQRVVLAAGLGNRGLGAPLDLEVPVRPDRGQILVTERMRPFLAFPSATIRQTSEGTILLGDSHEDAGFDSTATIPIMREISWRAVRTFPGLGRARLVRAWSGLRIITPDTYPIYEQSPNHPGAFVATAHSGVTLAAAHAEVLAKEIARGALPAARSPFGLARFNVHTTA